MAKKKSEKTAYNNEESFFTRLSLFFKSEQTHFVIGLCFALFGVYLMLAFISFFFTGAADQSRLENLSFGDLSSVKNEITNWMCSQAVKHQIRAAPLFKSCNKLLIFLISPELQPPYIRTPYLFDLLASLAPKRFVPCQGRKQKTGG